LSLSTIYLAAPVSLLSAAHLYLPFPEFRGCRFI